MMKQQLKNNIEVVIRDAEISDARNIIQYLKRVSIESQNLLREPNEVTITVDEEVAFLRRVMDSSNEHLFTVWHHDRLISVTGFHGSELNRIKHRVSFGISVLKDYQHLGLGTVLVKLLCDTAKAYGKTRMELDVREDNEHAIKLYLKTGFEIEGRRKSGICVHGTYIDLLLMGKDL